VCGCPLLQGVLWRALWRVHARRLLLTAAVKVVHDLLMFLQPYILELLLHHLSSGARDRCGGVLTQ
jgi:ATP-binding cassette subfamily C (CFTR/MRP) protein 1